MKNKKKSDSARTGAKLKDLKSKKNPTGGVLAASISTAMRGSPNPPKTNPGSGPNC